LRFTDETGKLPCSDLVACICSIIQVE
jgi:hypothetical protein